MSRRLYSFSGHKGHIHPADRPNQRLHVTIDGEIIYFVDNRLCMGLSSSPYIFSKISDFIVRYANREGVATVINYVDDFALVGIYNLRCCQNVKQQTNKLSTD